MEEFNPKPDRDVAWVEQNIISRSDLIHFMKSHLKMIPVMLDEGYAGQLWSIDGFTKVADDILIYMKERKIKRGLKTKEE